MASMKVPARRRGNPALVMVMTPSLTVASMKVPARRRGNPLRRSRWLVADVSLNESPRPKAGKSSSDSRCSASFALPQ